MDLGFGPDERLGVGVVGLNEGIDMRSELFDRGEGSTFQGFPLQDREPDFHLVEPGSPGRREVEAHVPVMHIQRSFLGLWVLRLSSTTRIAVLRLAATMSFMKSRNSTRRRRVL